MKNGPLPTRIRLPWGYLISVVELSSAEYAENCGEDSLACWIAEERRIYLRAARPIKKKRADLAHELLHAVADWQVSLLGSDHADSKD